MHLLACTTGDACWCFVLCRQAELDRLMHDLAAANQRADVAQAERSTLKLALADAQAAAADAALQARTAQARGDRLDKELLSTR
jgi:hypothetical protein